MMPSAHALVTEAAQRREVHAAFQFFHLREPTVFLWQMEATQVPSPPFGEQARAAWLLERFAALGLDGPRLDDEGNCLAELAGANPDAPRLLISAHIDTVFAADTPLEVRAEAERTYLPGLADNGTGIAALLAIAAACKAAELMPPVPILFCGNVGEEGIGNLRGMRRIFRDRDEHTIGAALVLDGTGTTPVVTQALGSRRFQITISGPGGHSWTDAANPNPVVALSRAITTMMSQTLPESPRTTVNFASVSGGDSINAIPATVTAQVDIRSEEGGEMIRQEVFLYRAVEDAVAETSAANAQAAALAAPPTSGAGAAGSLGASRVPGLAFQITPLGERPSGALPQDSFLIEAVRAVDRHLQIRTHWRAASTDANIPLSLGVPAVSLGAGGSSGGTHTLNEWFEPTGRGLALRRILLLALVTAEHLAREQP